MKKIFLAIAAAGMIFAGCSSDEPTIVDNNDAVQPDETPAPAVVMPKPTLNAAESNAAVSQTGFGADFFAAVSRDYPGKNVMTSPMSASMLLSMLANAADATTRSQICAVLGCSDVDAINSLSKKYMTWLPGADENITMSLANSLWFKQQYTLNPAFAAIASDSYNAETYARDFTNSGALVDEINVWTKRKTGNIIDKILDNIEPEAVAVQVNALYFNGSWTQHFFKEKTVKGDFKGIEKTVKADMMKAESHYDYAATDAFEAIEIPYGAHMYCSMVVVLPKEGTNLDEFVNSDAFKTVATTSMTDKLVNLTMPKFKIEPTEKISLNEILAAMGIDNLGSMQKTSLFTEAVDAYFRIYQKTGISVTEEGTEAAAATWNSWEIAPGPNEEEPKAIELTIDRPFVFFIKEKNTGLSLFAGKVNQL